MSLWCDSARGEGAVSRVIPQGSRLLSCSREGWHRERLLGALLVLDVCGWEPSSGTSSRE